MTGQQWAVIADRDKGDDPAFADVQEGDRYLAVSMPADWEQDRVERIERPVPTTCTCPPITTSQEPEPDEGCPKHGRSPHPPTREQIAEALDGLQLWTGVSSDPLTLDKSLSAQIAYALIQNGAER